MPETPTPTATAAYADPEAGVALNDHGTGKHDADATRTRRRRRMAIFGGLGLVVLIVAAAIIIWRATRSSSSGSSSPAPSADATLPDDGAPGVNASDGVLLCDNVQQDAGYITLPNKKDGHYFYWYFESRRRPRADPLVIWLTGGPGCSSLWALLAENGPCSVNANLTTTRNPFSWNSAANVIWLDQPLRTGYSYGSASADEDRSSVDVGQNLYAFLQGFYRKHPDLRTRPLFITGESYAGHYIPASAHYIWQQNVKARTETQRINLQGIAIGNGITAPSIQYAHYVDMADNAYNITLASPSDVAATKPLTADCVSSIQRCQRKAADCTMALFDCEDSVGSLFDNAKRNPYDIRKPCDNRGSDCYATPEIDEFLKSRRVQTYLRITLSKTPTWTMCQPNVSRAFISSGDFLTDHQQLIGELLDQSEIRVLIYAGDADTVCNWIGNEAWTLQLPWKHQGEFNAAKQRPFLLQNNATSFGVVRSYEKRFTFLRVYNSGHMVPMDQPEAAMEMLHRFLDNEDI